MDQLLNYLLTLVLNYGYPIIIALVALTYLGLPLPLNTIIVAAGAFTTSDNLDIVLLIPIVFLSAFIGDSVHFYLARKYGLIITKKLPIKLNHQFSNVIHKYLDSWGSGLIFITRWLLTSFGIPLNIIAGLNSFPVKKFLIWAGLGELVWAIIYTLIGQQLGVNWVLILDLINNTPLLLTFVVIGLILISVGLKMWHSRNRNPI